MFADFPERNFRSYELKLSGSPRTTKEEKTASAGAGNILYHRNRAGEIKEKEEQSLKST